jgi:very-short-patch-repair endonuclease
MTQHFNKKYMQKRRRQLRSNMTDCEKIIWKYLRGKKLNVRFLRQYSVDNYVIDFYCPELKLAIEIDGKIHEEAERMIYDKERQNHIEKYGIKFIRIKNEELLYNPKTSIQKIKFEIKELKLRNAQKLNL